MDRHKKAADVFLTQEAADVFLTQEAADVCLVGCVYDSRFITQDAAGVFLTQLGFRHHYEIMKVDTLDTISFN